MSISSISVRRPVLTIVASIFIVLFGVIAYTQLGVREFPSVDPPIITVSTSYTGASADVIQLFVDSRAELEDTLALAKAALSGPKGSLWVTYYKGTSKIKTDIHRDSINAYAHTLGLEGVAMVSIDDDWSALRLKVTV